MSRKNKVREFDVQPCALTARPDLTTCVVLGRALRFDYKKDYISKHSKSKSNQKSKSHSNSNPTSKPRLTSKWKSPSWLEKVPRNSLRVTLTQAIFEHRRIQDELVGQEMTNIRENVVVRDTDQEKMASSSRRRTFSPVKSRRLKHRRASSGSAETPKSIGNHKVFRSIVV